MPDIYRKCDQKGCDLPATHTYVWTRPMYGCRFHTMQAVGMAESMGFMTPFNTLKQLTPDEMVVEEWEE